MGPQGLTLGHQDSLDPASSSLSYGSLMGLPPETQLQGAEPQVAPSTPLYKDCLEVATEHPYGTACLWFPDNPHSHSSLIATVLAVPS